MNFLIAFIGMFTLQDFILRLKSWNHFVQHNIQYHRKELLSSFHLNGHTSKFHFKTQKLTTPYTA